jgi:hypothetical protein
MDFMESYDDHNYLWQILVNQPWLLLQEYLIINM